LSLPVAFYLVLSNNFAILGQHPSLIAAIIGLGLLSTLGLGSYILSSRYLPLVLFGLLSYFEPVLLALAAMWLGERIQAHEWLTYIPIWLAVLVLVLEGGYYLLKNRQQQRRLARKAKVFQPAAERE
jgi:chloramphenicol-sensitive protein RarD